MIFWYWFVLATAALSFTGYITLNIVLTVGLAIAAHFVFYISSSSKNILFTGLKAAVAAAAMALLLRESYLPPVKTIVDFLANPQTRPSAEYLWEFARQSVNFKMLLAGAMLFAAVFLASRKKIILLSISVYSILIAAWIMLPAQNISGLENASPEAFYKHESSRVVKFSAPAKDTPPFDVIILHICSLSWKDIKDARFDIMPFFSKFDYVFTDFSAACSYSGPAALRVLKSPCGQLPHPLLYTDAPANCYLMDNLRAFDFKTYTMFNHDGKYAGFNASVPEYGHADAPLGITGLPVAYEMFDGTPMFADNAVLHKFWGIREDSKAARVALYYNTANLHIGTHKPNAARDPDDAASYSQRLGEMTTQMEEFFSEIEKSGRNAVVIFIPEHGAALTGTKMQPKDVREIPLPHITILPVAVKIIGKSFYENEANPKVITKPASMQALAWLIAEFLRNNPYSKDARKPETIASEIPETDFMAENENAAVMKVGLGYIYRQKNNPWLPLPNYAGIQPGEIPSPKDFKRTR